LFANELHATTFFRNSSSVVRFNGFTMSMIPDEKVREVRARATILDVVSDYVNLKKSGSNFLGLCPLHGEKTPSFSVNPAKEIFHCFGCGAGGDVFGFIMRMEGLTFPESVKFLAKRVGVVIEDVHRLLRKNAGRKNLKHCDGYWNVLRHSMPGY
jgi:DNA primase catalytic core